MGTGASLAANSAAESVAGVRSSVLLRAFKGTDFTEAPPDLRGQEDEGSGPQWALMSALIERHTRQLELRAQYTALEKELERRYDEQEAKDKEFLDALMSVGQSIQQAKSPKTDEGKAQRLVDEAEEEASLRALKLEMDRESHRERMQARLIARKKSQRIRAQRSKAMDRHRQRKMSMWQSVRHVSRSLQRGFHATHHHFGGAFQKLEGVDKEMFELRREQAELSQRHRAAKTAHAKALRRLRNDLAIAEQTLNSAKARETTARLKEKDAKNHRHAAFVAKKNVEAALEEQREASIQVAKAKYVPDFCFSTRVCLHIKSRACRKALAADAPTSRNAQLFTVSLLFCFTGFRLNQRKIRCARRKIPFWQQKVVLHNGWWRS